MILAELLKLRKRRGLAWFSAVVVVGAVLVVIAVRVARHAVDADSFAPGGGGGGYDGAFGALVTTGFLAAVLIGATAGAGDVSAGVFRDLVATGVSRLRLFLVRIPGAVLALAALVLPAFALALAFGVIADGPDPAPSASEAFGDLARAGAALAAVLVVALGIASAIGRGTTIAIVLGWVFIVEPILSGTSALGDVRRAFVFPAIGRLVFGEADAPLEMSLAAALVTLAAWAGSASVVGALRTATRDA